MFGTFTNFPSTKGSKLTEISFIWSSRISPFGFFSWNNKRPRGQPRPQGLWADLVLEKAVASADILHPTFWGVNKLRPLNFNARNCFILQNFLYLLLQDKVNVHTLYNLYRYTTRSSNMFEWGILVEYFKNYPKFCTVALYLYAMHVVICIKIFWNPQYKTLDNF
jgi:hypothetical protein